MITALATHLKRLETRLSLSPEQRRMLRFLIVGGINTVVGYTLFVMFYLLTYRPNLSLVAATVIGVLFNFFSTGRIVFANRSWRALPGFVMAYGVALAMNAVTLNLLLHVGVATLIAQAISLPVVVLVSYLINSRLVFR